MTSFLPARGNRRMVLVFMGLGLVAMLAVSFGQRLSNPHLVVETQQGAPGAMGGQQGGMNPELGKLMQQVAENPNDVKTLVHLTEHLVNDQQWEAAENFARRAVVAAPGESQAQYLLGVVLHNKGQHEEAAQALERVVSIKDEASVRYSLGVLYIYYLKNTPKGVEHLTSGLHDPKTPESLKKAIREELEKAPLAGQKPEKAAQKPQKNVQK